MKFIHKSLYIKRLGVTVFYALCSVNCFAGQIANVDYIHKYITAKNGITVPIKETNPSKAANVKYLLCAIDKANEISVASTTTNYCTNALATTRVVDTVSVADVSNRLFNCNAGGYYKASGATVCSNCGAGYYCPAGGNLRNACTYGTIICKESNRAQDDGVALPPTINLANCTFNQPALTLAAAQSCLGTNNTVGHWQLVSTFTGVANSGIFDEVKKVGSISPGLYRIEMNYRSGSIGSLIMLTDKTVYYGHIDVGVQMSSRILFSTTNAFTVGVTFLDSSLAPIYCNWSDPNCYASSANGKTASLNDNDAVIDWPAGAQVPGITKANTETTVGASAIYKWVN